MSPFQHYWSLSVEEQFYLVWPLLLLAVLVVARRSRPADGRASIGLPRRSVGALLGGLTVLSFAWSVWYTATDPQQAYFATTTRAWELGLGALAALVGARLLRGTTRRLRGILCVAGLVAIGDRVRDLRRHHRDAGVRRPAAGPRQCAGAALGHGPRHRRGARAGAGQRGPLLGADAADRRLVLLALPVALAAAVDPAAARRPRAEPAHQPGAGRGRGGAVRGDVPLGRDAVPHQPADDHPPVGRPLPGRGGPGRRRHVLRRVVRRLGGRRARRQPAGHAAQLRRRGRVELRPADRAPPGTGRGVGHRRPQRHGAPERPDARPDRPARLGARRRRLRVLDRTSATLCPRGDPDGGQDDGGPRRLARPDVDPRARPDRRGVRLHRLLPGPPHCNPGQLQVGDPETGEPPRVHRVQRVGDGAGRGAAAGPRGGRRARRSPAAPASGSTASSTSRPGRRSRRRPGSGSPGCSRSCTSTRTAPC